MAKNEVVLNTLSNTAYEVQDNTITDTWGIVVDPANLPLELQGVQGYSITIGNLTYALEANKYNANVFSGLVSSIHHTLAEVKAGILTVK